MDSVVKKKKKDRYNCPATGAHFRFQDMARKLNQIVKERQQICWQTVAPITVGSTLSMMPPNIISQPDKQDQPA